ncbi:accessory colonization factor AcfC [bacterium]|nr:MAG: accessory colonization factor AcfC [bacterium]
MKRLSKIIFISLFGIVLSNISLQAQDTLFVFGPGGPYPAIQEVANQFTAETRIPVKITKGPLPNWKLQAEQQADLIYSGSEFMMSSFIGIFHDINPQTIAPLYLRKSGILVRPNNPKNIKTLQDLLKENVHIMVVNGSGLTGVWEDIIGRTGDINLMKQFRKNIYVEAANSGVAMKEWTSKPEIDVLITWNIWQVSNPTKGEFIELDHNLTSYRDCGIVLTKKGEKKSATLQFYEYIQSEKAKPVFKKWGWITE